MVEHGGAPRAIAVSDLRLICPRSRASAKDQFRPDAGETDRHKTNSNATTRTWKACCGQPLTSSNLVSSATPRSHKTAGQSQVLPRGTNEIAGAAPVLGGVVPSQLSVLSRGEYTALAVVWVTVIRPRRHTFRRSTTSTDHVVATTRVNPSSSPPSARSIVSSGSKPRPTKLQASSQRNQSSQPPGTMSAICTVTRPVLSQW
jgi:hypothetical protein